VVQARHSVLRRVEVTEEQGVDLAGGQNGNDILKWPHWEPFR
jgi:hypothetical protein